MTSTKPRPSIVHGESHTYPVLPLRDIVVFPHMIVPLFVGREKSIKALEEVMGADKQILLATQMNAADDDPEASAIYDVGTLANVLQLLKLPDGTVKVLVEGLNRATIDHYLQTDEYFEAEATKLLEPEGDAVEIEALARSAQTEFENYVKLNKKISAEVVNAVSQIDNPSKLADTIASHLVIKITEKEDLLGTVSVAERLQKILGLMEGEIGVLQVEKRIRSRVKRQMEKTQREYYLNEQMKAIQKELGEGEDSPNEVEELQKKIENAGMPKPVLAKARAEFGKLRQMSPMSAEATVVRNYLDWLVGVPWKKRSKVRKDLALAQQVLDADHFGLEKVKDRILEYLAVQHRVSVMKGPILCLVGPPGVGKTSLGQSIAKATNRKFVRMSLGGVRDEAEIRGHRRTYIGSMPGRIVQNLNKAGSKNPLFVLDEIDKMSMDFRGDPSSALLEVLDPEQNHAFNDHYLEVDLDLSEVMWIATANSLNIPGPLLDRMEVIRIPGYTEDEKLAIAQKYLLPKQLKANGLKPEELHVAEEAVRDIVRYYTRESGVRNLEREVSKICRKVVKELTLGEVRKAKGKPAAKATAKPAKGKAKAIAAVMVDSANLDHYLGVRRFDFGRKELQNEVGLVTGLAWTQVGGELLSIEASVVPGKGRLVHTGQLGDVMKESIQAALSVVRARVDRLGVDPEFHQKFDIHVHVPEGATPKDGPSAGIGMCTALVSALTKVPVRSEVAMTGEITLRGRVLPIGGLKEKLLAAHRGGITTVIIPEDNKKDLADMPANITASLEIHPVRWIDEVLDIALERPLQPNEPTAEPRAAAREEPADADEAEQHARPH